MKTAPQLLTEYLASIQDARATASLFAPDGALELPYLVSLGITSRVVGPAAIEQFIASLLEKVPDFAFKNIRMLIETDQQVFAEYEMEAQVLSTGKTYKQMYAGRLVAKDGKIALLRESLDTIAAANAFAP